MFRSKGLVALLSLSCVLVAACGEPPTPKPGKASATGPKGDAKAADKPSGDEAAAFAKEVDGRLRELWVAASKAEWEKSTNITDETEAAAAKANAAVMEYETQAIKDATKFDGAGGDPDTMRQIQLLKLTSTLPAPGDDAKREELAQIAAKLEGMYGKGKHCKGDKCRDLGELSEVLTGSRDYDAQLDAWLGWRTVSVPMREHYARMVEIANEGARDIGFADVGEVWRSRYDMTPQAFEQEMERLWNQVKPLYEQLHCHVRAGLNEKYGDRVATDGLIPAHLLGNMWAQDWANLYPMFEPHKGQASIDVTKALKRKGYDALKMVKLGEGFFTSLGLNELPETFWERSMFTKPKDRDVVCHASAWDVTNNNDLRIKMCIKIDHEDLVTIHHELGHNYYYNNYYTRPVLYQSGAHDGFHEAIGDAIALSITPSYLKEVGLLDKVSESPEAVLNKQMQDALGKIAFLPFGKMIDQWRWDVFSGKITPETFNSGWWELRKRYQGIAPPVERSEADFDPGAKYHIPGNTPYARYFLAHILQFQFHRALCAAAGHEGPLHECSIYGNKEAGKKLQGMLALGASKPWPDALEVLTGKREMDGNALIEYFKPLMEYLEQQNEGRKCGW